MNRIFCTTLLVLAAGVAQAQAPISTGSSSDGPRQLEAGRNAALDDQLWRQRLGRPLSEADLATRSIAEAIAQRDCPGAVGRLNAGLAKGHLEVIVLAATMYEDGLCLRPNWDRAVALLQRAHGAGSPVAAARLAAGYAAPTGGSDKAAALWWALQAGVAVPEVCRVDKAVVADADKFVATLGGWPAGRLDHCAYVAAVVASVQGQFDGRELSDVHDLVGEVSFNFSPAAGRIEIGDNVVTAPGTATAGDALGTRERRSLLVRLVRQSADRALARYTRPAGLDAAWGVRWSVQLKPAG